MRLASTSALALAALLIGCPDEPDPDPDPCAGEGDPELVLYQRLEASEIIDGSELPVFPPPQGGVFTELDVTLHGVHIEGVETLRVDVTDAMGTALAAQQYNGFGLPLLCQDDESIIIDNMPVGFYASTILQDLEGVGATLTVTLATTDEGEIVVTRNVVMRVTGY